MSAHTQSADTGGIFILLILLFLAAIIIVGMSPVPPQALNGSSQQLSDYCTCKSCGGRYLCGEVVNGKCGNCRWLEQHGRSGNEPRH